MNPSTRVASTGTGAQHSAPLGRAVCLQLLAQHRIGRLLFTDAALPAASPVSYVLDGDVVLVEIAPGSPLLRTVRDRVVGFQVDEIDPATTAGWAVLGVGQAYEVTDPRRRAVLSLHARSGQPDDRASRMLCIPLQRLTGSTLGPSGAPGIGGHPASGVASE